MSPRRPDTWVLAAFAAVAFGALIVCAFGFVSLVANTPVLSVQGLAVATVPLAVLAAVLGFCVVVRSVLAHGHPSFWAALVPTLGAYVTYALGMAGFAFVFGTPLGGVLGALAEATTGWSGPVVAALAAAVAWATIAVQRWSSRENPPGA